MTLLSQQGTITGAGGGGLERRKCLTCPGTQVHFLTFRGIPLCRAGAAGQRESQLDLVDKNPTPSYSNNTHTLTVGSRSQVPARTSWQHSIHSAICSSRSAHAAPHQQGSHPHGPPSLPAPDSPALSSLVLLRACQAIAGAPRTPGIGHGQGSLGFSASANGSVALPPAKMDLRERRQPQSCSGRASAPDRCSSGRWISLCQGEPWGRSFMCVPRGGARGIRKQGRL